MIDEESILKKKKGPNRGIQNEETRGLKKAHTFSLYRSDVFELPNDHSLYPFYVDTLHALQVHFLV